MSRSRVISIGSVVSTSARMRPALVQTNPALYNASSLPQARSASDLL